MAQSSRWQLLPRVQSTSLVWVGDHNQGLLIYILAIFALQFLNVIVQLEVMIMLVQCVS
jgi:hypothetical protein